MIESMRDNKLLSIIIVSYANYSILRDCLDSIDRMNDIGDALEVIVVEQSPTPEIFERISQSYPWVEVFSHENLGFGSGNNYGESHARGHYLLFLNSDTILIEPVFSFAIRQFEDNPCLGLFGVRLLNADGEAAQSFNFMDDASLVTGKLNTLFDKHDIFLSACMYITGADMFVRRAAFIEAGRFDERIFMYCEETDLCLRLRKQNWKIAYFKDHSIIHIGGASSGTSKTKTFETMDSFFYVMEKRGVSREKLAQRWMRNLRIKRMLGGNNPVSEYRLEYLKAMTKSNIREPVR